MRKTIEKEEILFDEFYRSFLRKTMDQLNEKIESYREYTSDRVIERFRQYAKMCLQGIAVRTLIVEMHICKEKGLLGNGNAEEQYKVFCKAIVGKAEFITYMKKKYPVLFECIEARLEMARDCYIEVIMHFKKDILQIQKAIKDDTVWRIEDICSSDSDFHNCGKQVFVIELDNGKKIIYKPHSMENEMEYMTLLRWISEGIGIEQYQYSIISRENYSWCEVVSYENCVQEWELQQYYKRLGIQLFLVYLLGTKDLHSENLIAHGEYPVFVDLETLVNIQYNQKRETAFQEICYQLSNSVLYTGILPFYHFNQKGKGINASGINGTENQKYPIQVPVVMDPYTSDMKIGYIHPRSKRTHNLVLLRGEFVAPIQYIENMKEGFSLAYKYALRKKNEFAKKMQKLKYLQSRYLLQDTQRYSMLVSASYHPSLLHNRSKREKFLSQIKNGRNCERKEILKVEEKALWRGDIPYFSYLLNDTALVSADGERIENYFEKTPLDLVYEKLDKLGEADLEKQCEFIQYSMRLTVENRGNVENSYYEVDCVKNHDVKNQKYIQKIIEELSKRLQVYAVWNDKHTEVSWFTVQMFSFGKPTWDIQPMNMYLYDGLSGMLLIMYEMQKKNKQKFYEYYDTLRNMLWKYTDYMYENLGSGNVRNTGLYDGEGSVLYTYCLLCKRGEREYLWYAKKHAMVVRRMLKYDQKCDLLNGNAGGALALINLYELTGDHIYLSYAEEAVALLEDNAIEMEQGIGWIVESEYPPFTGMAHGNSGFILPVASLLQYTGKEKYNLLCHKILNYENSLYDERLGNWRDVRGGTMENTIDSVSWCHGAGGILLSRVYCYEKIQDEEIRKILERDIVRSYQKLRGYGRRESWILCHGICGNTWILKRTRKIVEQLVGKEEVIDIIERREKISLLPQESLNPGLMNGYGGILLYFLKY